MITTVSKKRQSMDHRCRSRTLGNRWTRYFGRLNVCSFFLISFSITGSVTSKDRSSKIHVSSPLFKRSIDFGAVESPSIKLTKNWIEKRFCLAKARHGAGLRFKTLCLDLKTNRSFYRKVENMNLDKLFVWIIAVVLTFAAVGRLDVLQAWVWQAQAKLIYESHTETWGSPRFFPQR